MVEVEIRNFQSIERVTVQIDGFTALVGRSNIGKSAIVRAVKSALTGAPVDAMVRHGPECSRHLKDTKTCKCACSVAIRAKDFDLFWEKGDSVNRYVFNGKEYTVAGKGTPEFLQDTFGLVKIAEAKELVQIADQFSPIFLLDQTGTVVADVLSDVARLDSINVAMRLVEKDRKEAASNRKLREKDVLELKIRSMSYDGLDAVVTQVRDVEGKLLAIDSGRAKVADLDRTLTTAFALGRDIKSLIKTSTLIVPEIAPVQEASRAYTFLCQVEVTALDRQTAIKVLEKVDTIDIPDAEPMGVLQTTFAQLDGWVAKLRTAKDLFTRCKAVETVEAPDKDALSVAASRFTGLAGLAQRYEVAAKAVGAIEADYEAAVEEFATVKGEIDTLGLCPTCTQPISSERHVHAGVAGA